MKKYLLLVVSVIVSVLASLSVVWFLSRILGFNYNPEIIAVLAASAVAVTFIRNQQKAHKKGGNPHHPDIDNGSN